MTRRSCLRRIALVAVANALSVRVHLRPVVAAEAQLKPTDYERAAITAIVKAFMNQFKVPAFSLAIARHGQFVYQESLRFRGQGSWRASNALPFVSYRERNEADNVRRSFLSYRTRSLKAGRFYLRSARIVAV